MSRRVDLARAWDGVVQDSGPGGGCQACDPAVRGTGAASLFRLCPHCIDAIPASMALSDTLAWLREFRVSLGYAL